MNKKLPAWIVLTVICLVAALALAFTYNGTKDRIAQQEEAKTVAVRQALLPAAASFEAVDGSEVYRGVDANGAAVGYVTVNTVKGFGGDVEISVAVDPEGVIQGISVGGANFKETAGLGAKSKEPAFTEQFAGKTAPVALKKNGGEIDAITAATITSSAVVRGVNDAVTMLAEKAGFTIQQAASAVEEKGNGRYATEKQGFAGPVYVELALDGEGKITEIAIGDDRFSETSGFGAKAREEAFYGQYIGKTGQLTLGQDIDAVAVALHHFPYSAHLAFNSRKTVDQIFVFFFVPHFFPVAFTAVCTTFTHEVSSLCSVTLYTPSGYEFMILFCPGFVNLRFLPQARRTASGLPDLPRCTPPPARSPTALRRDRPRAPFSPQDSPLQGTAAHPHAHFPDPSSYQAPPLTECPYRPTDIPEMFPHGMQKPL